MNILLIDNDTSRRSDHEENIDFSRGEHLLIIKESVGIEELKENRFDIYVVHHANVKEYKYVYQNQLGNYRIFFTGACDKPRDNGTFGYFADPKAMYKRINQILKNDS
jgi:hypothetical protein